MSRDYFNAIAAAWDTPVRVERAREIAAIILRELPLRADTVLADYGCGTGLVAAALAPHVAHIVALDNAANMLSVLSENCQAAGIACIEPRLCDIETESFAEPFCDIFVSSMVLHHLRSPESYARAAWRALRRGGVVAVIDLDPDGGEFHTGGDQVHHHGFDRTALTGVFAEAGFAVPQLRSVLTIRKRGRSGLERDFPVFLLQARKP